MKKILVYLTLSFAFLIISVCPVRNAFSVEANTQEKDSEEYIIQKGDTLWGISDTKLEDTFLWPKLWNVNPQINNPDLIYPGSKIIIPSREELMQMPPVPEKKIPAIVKQKPKKTLFMPPQKRVRRYILNKDLYMASGWISPEFPGIGEIIYSQTGRQMAGKGDIVYLKFPDKETTPSSGSSQETKLMVVQTKKEIYEKKFFIIRDVKIVKHPVTRKVLGHQIRVTGILEIIGMESNIPKAKVTKSFEDVQIGDSLLPFWEMEPPFIPDAVNTPKISGYIVESHMNSEVLGKGNIVFLDKGQDDGLAIGDVFLNLSEIPVERPIGTLQIISLQPTTSVAFILKSAQEILVGTKWGNK